MMLIDEIVQGKIITGFAAVICFLVAIIFCGFGHRIYEVVFGISSAIASFLGLSHLVKVFGLVEYYYSILVLIVSLAVGIMVYLYLEPMLSGIVVVCGLAAGFLTTEFFAVYLPQSIQNYGWVIIPACFGILAGLFAYFFVAIAVGVVFVMMGTLMSMAGAHLVLKLFQINTTDAKWDYIVFPIAACFFVFGIIVQARDMKMKSNPSSNAARNTKKMPMIENNQHAAV